MADQDLIRAYLAELAQRLPPEAVEELADGLHETFQHHLQRGLAPIDAAHSAITEFGPPLQVAAAFAHQSPGRRTAIALLATAPILAALWGTTLISARAWTWQIPTIAAVAFGAILLAVAATLMNVARTSTPARTRLAGPASVALIVVDLAMLTAIAVVAPPVTWPMALAILASLARAALSGHNLPRAFAL